MMIRRRKPKNVHRTLLQCHLVHQETHEETQDSSRHCVVTVRLIDRLLRKVFLF
jgi:hypothetical protein